MSKETQQFLEGIKPDQSMGAVEAAVEGVKRGAAACLEGLGKVWDAGQPMFDKGRTELAAVLFSGNDRGFVMYGGNDNKQTQDHAPDHGLGIEPMKQPEVEQDRGGMSM